MQGPYSLRGLVWQSYSGTGRRTAVACTRGWPPRPSTGWAPCYTSGGTHYLVDPPGPTEHPYLLNYILYIFTFSKFFPTLESICSSIISITMPLSSIPRLPARPLIWIYSPEVIYIWVLIKTFNKTVTYPSKVLSIKFSSTSEDNSSSGHVQTQRKCFRCKQCLYQTLREKNLNGLLEYGKESRVMYANTSLQQWQQMNHLRTWENPIW